MQARYMHKIDCTGADVLNELKHLKRYLETYNTVVLAVVTETWGSAPRRPGSIMVVGKDGTFEGSVSGGCVEGSVISEAQALFEPSSARIRTKELEFSVATEEAWQVGLACGGTIKISLFKLGNDALEAIDGAIFSMENRHFGALSVKDDTIGFTKTLDTEIVAQLEVSGENLVLPVTVSPKLVVVGAVHIAQHLSVMAQECGMLVQIIDPRQAFTDSRTFGAAEVTNDWPDDYFANKPVDAGTAVITLTHDPKLDDAALIATLESNAFYFGCLGSKKTNASRLKRLQEHGFGAETLAKINGPIGLDIDTSNPAEIAVSILAEVIQTWRQRVEV